MGIENRQRRWKAWKKGEWPEMLGHLMVEVILVMVGILLALQVSNWNEDRVNKAKEKKILHDLVVEFELNKERIFQKQQARLNVSSRLQTYISAISAGDASYDDVLKLHGSEYFVGFTNPSGGVVEALISSGQLALISNDSLKYLLADWNDQIKNLYENEQILWNTTVDYQKEFHSFILDPKQVWNDFGIERQRESVKRMLCSVSYRNALSSYNGAQNAVIEECKELLDYMELISGLLKRLKSRN